MADLWLEEFNKALPFVNLNVKQLSVTNIWFSTLKGFCDDGKTFLDSSSIYEGPVILIKCMDLYVRMIADSSQGRIETHQICIQSTSKALPNLLCNMVMQVRRVNT